MTVANSMEIAWKDENGTEIVKGIYFYAYFPKTVTPDIINKHSFNSSDPSVYFHIDLFTISEDAAFTEVHSGTIMVLSARFDAWPDNLRWRAFVKDTLHTLTECGALLTWCGNELSSYSPDSLNPHLGGADVYAAYSPKIGYLCRSPLLTDTYEPLSDNEMSRIYSTLFEEDL
uniref:Uncharacterized protein n=1 Tax=Rubinisphaera brasiliensis (strain ATCC 49424 / DSM 5305 / JCM 21570 / IAM 15109 / NBRC 103401 / IFAM 1448) TaxID=756272 RepID=F0SQD8_RUBBR|nr:hypothetical protein Plabr_4746 [Rubinisphaera brasiliensis DSM 5305]